MPLRVPNYFYGFSIEGISLSLLSGALIGVGARIMRSHDKILDADDDLESAAVGSGLFAFGLYAWVPPLVRKYYHYFGEEVSSASSIMGQVALNSAGCAFAFLTGTILGSGIGFLRCDPKKPKRAERIVQTATGYGLFMAGLFAASPTMLKMAWVTAYILVDDGKAKSSTPPPSIPPPTPKSGGRWF